MKVVTSGTAYLDIDAYGGCIAYAELLNMLGTEAIAATTAPLNESITRTIRSWHAPLETAYTPNDSDTYILIDISYPDYFDTFVAMDRVEEVIDHHPGFENHWKDRIGDKATIEFIGAACTQVYEKWIAAGLLSKMSQTSARLLVSGILDNTLNFKAHVTTQRDKQAYEALLKIADLPSDWPAIYFSECQQSILSDLPHALGNDVKDIVFTRLVQKPASVGQLVIWDAKEVLASHQSVISKIMRNNGDNWFVNIVSIDAGKSYFLSDNPVVQQWLAAVLGVHFNGQTAEANRLWLRKEIIKQDLSGPA